GDRFAGQHAFAQSSARIDGIGTGHCDLLGSLCSKLQHTMVNDTGTHQTDPIEGHPPPEEITQLLTGVDPADISDICDRVEE
ncbi:hypothetical protein, partial [Rhodococcus cercidiphylli]